MKYMVLSMVLLTACNASTPNPIVILETTVGEIEMTIYPQSAPISSADFLRYVDNGLYEGQGFYRVVRADNDPLKMGMSLIQGGRLDSEIIGDPIAHELTTQTGISNSEEGAVAIARLEPGSGSAAYFFINIGPNDFLDTGGTRNPDRQGYATFARVTDGIEVVKSIQAMDVEESDDSEDSVTNGQILAEPVIITRAYRK